MLVTVSQASALEIAGKSDLGRGSDALDVGPVGADVDIEEEAARERQ